MLLGVKTAEDGDGMIVRLQEFDGKETTVTVWLNEALGITSASVTDFLERDLRPATVEKAGGGVVVREAIGPKGYLTLKLK
jgi:alpha-mannosidase